MPGFITKIHETISLQPCQGSIDSIQSKPCKFYKGISIASRISGYQMVYHPVDILVSHYSHILSLNSLEYFPRTLTLTIDCDDRKAYEDCIQP